MANKPIGERSKKDRDIWVCNVLGKSKHWQVLYRGVVLEGPLRFQAAAIRVGKDEAKKRRVDLVVCKRNGRIKSRTSYGNDPRGRKG